MSTAVHKRQVMAFRGPRPCDGCNSLARCAMSPIACRDFSHFVSTGQVRRESRVPSAELFTKTMRHE